MRIQLSLDLLDATFTDEGDTQNDPFNISNVK